ncbi:MAG: aminotransferase class I/II-fold pyridoxal phosphate-dependent enzyme, partial [Actinomycetota bacterium]|nr:aminotransferase class I/II-fold pyridoxal phosphate-dependent enzyme [Actinomycetota bacterium]
MGTPVDPTPPFIAAALAAHSNAPGYPTALGTAEFHTAAAGWLQRRLGVRAVAESILPTIGSKETVAWLPTMLGIAAGSTVLIPELSYPTYEVGALLAGAQVRRVPRPPKDAAGISLVWLNSPANPHGAVLTATELQRWVAWGRALSVPIVADECYLELGWSAQPVSILHPSVVGNSPAGVLAVHSLS